jgi:glycosyltransferase involved in cell wall biosynthesis
MTALLRRASIVAMPSRWPEPSGIIGLEAMAHGRPVVAFATGGIPEWLVHGETGLLAPPLDVPALAGAIAALLGDEANAKRMGEMGRARARRLFSPGPHLAQLSAIYHALPEPR